MATMRLSSWIGIAANQRVVLHDSANLAEGSGGEGDEEKQMMYCTSWFPEVVQTAVDG